MYRTFVIIAAFVGAAIPLAATAKSPDFDPQTACHITLENAGSTTKGLIVSWAMGFEAARYGDVRPLNREAAYAMLARIEADCAEFPDASLVSLLRGQPEPAIDDDGDGSEASARALLENFLYRDADLETLSRALYPTAEDIRAVYKEPLATRLIEMYAPLFETNPVITPKPDQTEVLIVYTSTTALLAGDPVKMELPGGYRDVIPQMNPGFPFVRFKFVAKGRTIGTAFDGLVWVNDRWVLMPKPWRAL